jgi:hypothetical protein
LHCSEVIPSCWKVCSFYFFSLHINLLMFFQCCAGCSLVFQQFLLFGSCFFLFDSLFSVKHSAWCVISSIASANCILCTIAAFTLSLYCIYSVILQYLQWFVQCKFLVRVM